MRALDGAEAGRVRVVGVCRGALRGAAVGAVGLGIGLGCPVGMCLLEEAVAVLLLGAVLGLSIK